MMIIGCDFHTRYQQIAMMDEATGELIERRLDHESGEAHAFYRDLQDRCGWASKPPVRFTGSSGCWRNWVTNFGSGTRRRFAPAKCASRRPMNAMPGSFSICCWRNAFRKSGSPPPSERDLRQLLWHRHKLVCMRTMLGNQLHALAMSEGLCRKRKLFTKKGRRELEGLTLAPWASRRREELLKLLDQLEPPIAELDRAVMEEAKRREDAVLA